MPRLLPATLDILLVATLLAGLRRSGNFEFATDSISSPALRWFIFQFLFMGERVLDVLLVLARKYPAVFRPRNGHKPSVTYSPTPPPPPPPPPLSIQPPHPQHQQLQLLHHPHHSQPHTIQRPQSPQQIIMTYHNEYPYEIPEPPYDHHRHHHQPAMVTTSMPIYTTSSVSHHGGPRALVPVVTTPTSRARRVVQTWSPHSAVVEYPKEDQRYGHRRTAGPER
ncbi:hypothetical protein DFJ77DRAFT_236333 [Powellomyces hirtus]|nr:hypothetical protein DFJ77DRAFT_236333 [Powellomyces hirtus]